MIIIPVIIVGVAFTIGYLTKADLQKAEIDIVAVEESVRTDDSKSGLYDDAKAVIGDSKDAKVPIEMPPHLDVMDRIYIDWNPPIIHPPCVTEVNFRPCWEKD